VLLEDRKEIAGNAIFHEDHLDRCHSEKSKLSSDIEENLKKIEHKDNVILKLKK